MSPKPWAFDEAYSTMHEIAPHLLAETECHLRSVGPYHTRGYSVAGRSVLRLAGARVQQDYWLLLSPSSLQRTF